MWHGQIQPTPIFVSKVLLEYSQLIHLCIVYGCFHTVTAELSSYKISYGPKCLKYLRSGPLQRKFATFALYNKNPLFPFLSKGSQASKIK